MSGIELENDAEMPVGAYLRSVRESRGLQLDEAARVTRIGKNYLAAIEEGDFDRLPNAAYIKGFLRLYAGFLSLSGDDVVASYERSLPPAAGPQAEPSALGPGMETVEKTKLAGQGRFLVPALLLALVVLAAFLYYDGEEEEALAPPPAAVQVPVARPVLAPMTAAVQRRLSSARTEPVLPAAPAEPAVAPAPAVRPSGVVLRLRFKKDSWLSITIDDRISQNYDLKAGDIIEWKGARAFVLDLGDGGAVEAEFNGRPLEALGEPGQPAHVELKDERPA